jgi:uncharacterized membrane protein YGL010W
MATAAESTSPVLRSHFADYAEFHRTPGNKLCHYVGIPVIVLSLLSLLARVPLFAVGGFTLTLAEVTLLAATAYYLRLDAGLAVLMLAVGVAFDAAARRVPFAAALAAFGAGWALQFVGHYVYEKKSPAFFRHMAHLLVGPLWILGRLSGRA